MRLDTGEPITIRPFYRGGFEAVVWLKSPPVGLDCHALGATEKEAARHLQFYVRSIRKQRIDKMFKEYRRKQIAQLRPYEPGEVLSDRVSISAADREAGSPKAGDMIARNPANHNDQWLVAADYFAANFERIESIDEKQATLDVEAKGFRGAASLVGLAWRELERDHPEAQDNKPFQAGLVRMQRIERALLDASRATPKE